MTMLAKICFGVLFVLAALSASAHHSVLHYDGKQEIVISGTITAGRFAFPHSVYHLDVINQDGESEQWTLRTEDPRDAKRLGFAETLKALKVGDRLTAVGWPHRFEDKEIRGHQLHFDDGRVVFLRRGNYIWPKDIRRIGYLVENPSVLAELIKNAGEHSRTVDQLLAWAEENEPVGRVANEIAQEQPRLIGVDRGDGAVFPGVEELLRCHTRRSNFSATIDFKSLDEDEQKSVNDASAYLAEFNRLLSRWWEQERSSCS